MRLNRDQIVCGTSELGLRTERWILRRFQKMVVRWRRRRVLTHVHLANKRDQWRLREVWGILYSGKIYGRLACLLRLCTQLLHSSSFSSPIAFISPLYMLYIVPSWKLEGALKCRTRRVFVVVRRVAFQLLRRIPWVPWSIFKWWWAFSHG